MKYQPSKDFILIILPLGTLVISLGFGLLPELEQIEARPIPGEITFKHSKPETVLTKTVSSRKSSILSWSMDWFEETYENVMTWEHNPWKRRSSDFGDHFWKLCESADPNDQAKVRELRRLAEAWHQKLRLRFPDLAVPMRNVPDERNGFLKWLDFADRMEAGMTKGTSQIGFPKEITDYLSDKGAWNPEAANAWLTQQKPLLDEVRAIGLMPDRSVNGIPIERWGFSSARLVKGWSDALMMDARLAAEQGDAATALESVRAARGLGDHFGEVETPSLLAATVQILVQLNLQNQVMTHILPALPPDQVDPEVWENALSPKASAPADFARLMKGEWAVSSTYFLLPHLLDSEDPKTPPDSGELLDFYSTQFSEIVARHEGTASSDLSGVQWPAIPDDSHLSRASRQAIKDLFIGTQAWRRGWDRSQSAQAMAQAAFAIMKGQPVPTDPVYGAAYRWDPHTRQLSAPDTPEFREWNFKPITVPNIQR
ncbi:MAG: hypothetical protein V4584_01155 [Verrucomicrobiota bacterium]